MFSWLKRQTQPADANEAETDQEPASKRGNDRQNAYAEAKVTTLHGMEKRGVILNLSDVGAKIRFVSADGLVKDDTISISIPRHNLKCRAIVQWKDKTDIGLRFI